MATTFTLMIQHHFPYGTLQMTFSLKDKRHDVQQIHTFMLHADCVSQAVLGRILTHVCFLYLFLIIMKIGGVRTSSRARFFFFHKHVLHSLEIGHNLAKTGKAKGTYTAAASPSEPIGNKPVD